MHSNRSFTTYKKFRVSWGSSHLEVMSPTEARPKVLKDETIGGSVGFQKHKDLSLLIPNDFEDEYDLRLIFQLFNSLPAFASQKGCLSLSWKKNHGGMTFLAGLCHTSTWGFKSWSLAFVKCGDDPPNQQWFSEVYRTVGGNLKSVQASGKDKTS